MRTIIAGTRSDRPAVDIFANDLIYAVNKSGFKITKILCGRARGPDMAGSYYAGVNNIELQNYPANWEKFGKGAGHIRNIEMAQNADALILLWDGISKGSGHMLDTARTLGLKIHVEWFTP